MILPPSDLSAGIKLFRRSCSNEVMIDFTAGNIQVNVMITIKLSIKSNDYDQLSNRPLIVGLLKHLCVNCCSTLWMVNSDACYKIDNLRLKLSKIFDYIFESYFERFSTVFQVNIFIDPEVIQAYRGACSPFSQNY